MNTSLQKVVYSLHKESNVSGKLSGTAITISFFFFLIPHLIPTAILIFLRPLRSRPQFVRRDGVSVTTHRFLRVGFAPKRSVRFVGYDLRQITQAGRVQSEGNEKERNFGTKYTPGGPMEIGRV